MTEQGICVVTHPLSSSGENATRTLTWATATGDAVDALRDVRQSQASREPEKSEDGDRTTASNEGDARPPDDDRTKPSDDGGTNR